MDRYLLNNTLTTCLDTITFHTTANHNYLNNNPNTRIHLFNYFSIYISENYKRIVHS